MKTVEITYRFLSGPQARARPGNAQEARDRLDQGNRAFATLFESATDPQGVARRIVDLDPRDLGIAAGVQGKPPQRPFAAVVGCADARVPVELVFNEGPNDLFVVRVAGNGLGQEVLGSLRYAVEHLAGNLQLVVVLGHSGCGAVSSAVDIFLDPARYLALATSHMLRSVLDRLLVVVHASARRMADAFGPEIARNPGYREALTEMAVVTNAALTAHTLQCELATELTDVRAAYGIYLLETRQVWSPRGGGTMGIGLADPPRDLAAFIELGDAMARSARIASLLAPRT